MTESVTTIVLIIPVLLILAFLLVLLKLTGKSDFKFRARGFGVSVNLESDSEACETLQKLGDTQPTSSKGE